MILTSEHIAFPTLDAEQMAAVISIGDLLVFEPEEFLIQQGQKDYPFYVIKSGAVRIVEKCGDYERLVATHNAGSFTGDVDMLTGRTAVISAIANENVEAYRLCAPRLRKVLLQCSKMSDMLLEAFQLRRMLLEQSEFVGVAVVGDPNSSASVRLMEFFYKNHVPYTFYLAGSVEGQSTLDCLDAHSLPLPVVHCNGHIIGNPSLTGLAECIGISRDVGTQVYDLVIVGSGPAGLAAAVYSASEKISTLVVDSMGPGGQAASSSKIENFIGFPSGLSGSDLANRGYLQALKFGAQFVAPVAVHSIDRDESGIFGLSLCNGQTARARSVLIATGVNYRQLGVEGCQRFEGAGIYYAATSVESRVCEDSTAIVVGGGNSAGQAAMFLANTAACVKILIRGDDLAKSMSAYLCERIENHSKIEVIKNSELVEVIGEQMLQQVVVRDNRSGEQSVVACAGLFIFIGASPHTDWLPPDILLDDKGYVMTGSAVEASGVWPLDRAPCDLETSVPGIFAAGDVRSGTTKRCGFAVGDGSLAVACVHRYFGFG
jgi:thioredoxin reductase (NADPH)